jgi:hypothetical protein
MDEITFEVVTLEWERVQLPARSTWPGIEGIPDDVAGLYQVYGHSPVYGPHSLLYIGQGDPVKRRLEQHFSADSALSRQQWLSLRWARLDAGLLDAVESILIANHKPSFNSEYINAPCMTDRPVMVQNHGERGALILQVTNSYWLDPA